jgi:hypothetical protein
VCVECDIVWWNITVGSSWYVYERRGQFKVWKGRFGLNRYIVLDLRIDTGKKKFPRSHYLCVPPDFAGRIIDGDVR